ncbi:hypothetical protein BDQ17DRAFT_1335930 [Cyathus striatus]|nr:hypothetical protein BDQ17DRAFT_1335930 [Cyathus striatus]
MFPGYPTVPEEPSSNRSAEVVSPMQVSSFGGASRVDFSRSQIYNIGGSLNNGFNHVLQPEQVTSQLLPNNTINLKANQQPELEMLGEEAEERDNEVYAHLLFTKRRGFPLWYPTPDPTLPEEYLGMGN